MVLAPTKVVDQSTEIVKSIPMQKLVNFWNGFT